MRTADWNLQVAHDTAADFNLDAKKFNLNKSNEKRVHEVSSSAETVLSRFHSFANHFI